MNNLNSTILEGNAVRKPELKTTPKGTNICVLPIAVNRYYKNTSGGYDSEVSYFDIESFGKLADFCAEKAEKGQGVRIAGRLKQNRWKTAEGEGRSRITVIAEHIELKPLKKKDEDQKEHKTSTKNLAESCTETDELSEAAAAMASENETVF